MKISDMIKKLNDIKNANGDLTIKACSWDNDGSDFTDDNMMVDTVDDTGIMTLDICCLSSMQKGASKKRPPS